MAITTTTNLGLKKVDDATTVPDAFDAANDNMDALDAKIHDLGESVPTLILAGLVSSGEFSYASSDNTLNFVFKLNDGTQRIIGFTSTQIRFYKRAQGETTLLWSK